MLTSNIFKKIKHQNWGAAFIDFLVVVLGIFVAIQVNGWNEERINNQKEKVILNQLYNEVSSNIEHIKLLVNAHKKRVAGLDYVVKGIIDGTIEPSSSKAKDPIITMFQLPPLRISMSTYHSLVATGDIALINDPELKALLFSVEAAVEAEKSYIDYFRQINISDLDYSRGLITLKPKIDKTGTTVHVDFERLLKDGSLLIILTNSQHTHSLFSQVREDLAIRFEKVKTYIDNTPNKIRI